MAGDDCGGENKKCKSQRIVMETFSECARKHFDFLTHEYQFTHGEKPDVLPEQGNSRYSVRYDAPHIFIQILLDKNDVCVILFAKVHTSILRPYEQRIFLLPEILRYVSPESLKTYPESTTPDRSPENFDDFLKFYAAGLRQHCDALLRMDLKLLEQTFQWGRAKA
jgi:hypothetical protein